MISAFYCNTSTRESRLMQMLCKGFKSQLYWFTIFNNTTVTVRHKRTKAFLGKMNFVGLEKEVEELVSSVGFCLPLFNLLPLQRSSNGWWQHFKEYYYISICWNSSSYSCLESDTTVDDLYKATQTGITVLPPTPYLPEVCFQASVIPSSVLAEVFVQLQGKTDCGIDMD